jgi:hypothetical protein
MLGKIIPLRIRKPIIPRNLKRREIQGKAPEETGKTGLEISQSEKECDPAS